MVIFVANFRGGGGVIALLLFLNVFFNFKIFFKMSLLAITSKLNLKSNAACVCMCLPFL